MKEQTKKVNKIEKKKVRIVFTIAKHPTFITKQETNARDKKNRLKNKLHLHLYVRNSQLIKNYNQKDVNRHTLSQTHSHTYIHQQKLTHTHIHRTAEQIQKPTLTLISGKY